MPIQDIVLRTAKELYERRAFDEGKKQLHEFLFPNENTSTAAGFALDKLIRNTYGVRYTIGQSAVRAMQAGKSTVIVPPRASEKTPLTGDLLDAVVAGAEAIESFDSNKAQLVANIGTEHYDAFTMTKNKQAVDVMIDGVFKATGMIGEELDLSIDYGRAAGNSLTKDFTSDPSFGEAVTPAMELMIANGAVQIMAIAGKNWLSRWSGDTDVIAFMTANANNTILIQPMVEEIDGVQGLYMSGQYRPQNLAVPFVLAQYQPGVPYRATEASAGVPFVGDNDIVFFGMSAPRYTVNRRVDTIENGEVSHDAAPLVADRFHSDDPAAEFLRTQSRHAFVPADIDQIVKVTGSNF